MRKLMKGYKQLTQIQRYQIESLKKAEMFQKDIAVIIGISASILSKELSAIREIAAIDLIRLILRHSAGGKMLSRQ